jgi:hypothetical protein
MNIIIILDEFMPDFELWQADCKFVQPPVAAVMFFIFDPRPFKDFLTPLHVQGG